uniref:Cell division cycle associated 8 n=1 Tax=Neolamprologus brichardi TaxID=32507 RepID=A0A3Q4H6K2_NEOBR
MAPRKRTTKQRKNNPKTAKLEAFLEDFDSEVKTRVGQLKEKINQLLKDVDNSYNMAIIKLPKAVRQMNWLEHWSKKEEAALVESVVAKDHTSLLKTIEKSELKVVYTFPLKQENHFPLANAICFVQSTASKKKASLVANKCDANALSLFGFRSNRNPLITPARSLLDSSLMMGPTPLITPRFDPRLPKTPAVRVPRHKERVYSISVNGSPIAAGNEDIVINVPVGNGESIQLLASQMDSVDLSLLDEAAMRSIRQLQNRLTTLCGTSE